MDDRIFILIFAILLLIGWFVDYLGPLHILSTYGLMFFIGRYSKGES